MLASIFSLNVLQTALELGCIYGLVALALFLSYSILNIADLSTDGCFTLGAVVGAVVAISGHPYLSIPAAMLAGVASGFITAILQTKMGVNSLLAGIIVNTGLYSVNIAIMGGSSILNMNKADTVFTAVKSALARINMSEQYKLAVAAAAVIIIAALLGLFLKTRLGIFGFCGAVKKRLEIIELLKEKSFSANRNFAAQQFSCRHTNQLCAGSISGHHKNG